MTDSATFQSHPHVSDATITSPEEATEYLKQSSSAPLPQLSPREQPVAWFDRYVPHPDYAWKEYTLRWSGTPYSKWDWVELYFRIHSFDSIDFGDYPPVMTASDGISSYVTKPYQIAWQWVSSGDSYKIRFKNEDDERLRGKTVPWKEGERGPFARYFWWDAEVKKYVYASKPSAPAE
jgi:hypothetical protein